MEEDEEVCGGGDPKAQPRESWETWGVQEVMGVPLTDFNKLQQVFRIWGFTKLGVPFPGSLYQGS